MHPADVGSDAVPLWRRGDDRFAPIGLRGRAQRRAIEARSVSNPPAALRRAGLRERTDSQPSIQDISLVTADMIVMRPGGPQASGATSGGSAVRVPSFRRGRTLTIGTVAALCIAMTFGASAEGATPS